MIVVIIFKIETTVLLKEIHSELELLNDFGLKLVIKQSMFYNKLSPFDPFFEPSIILLYNPNLKLDFLLTISIIKL